MSQNDNDILAHSLSIFGKGSLLWLAATFLPNNVYQLSLDVATHPLRVITLVTDILKNEGALLEGENSDEILAPDAVTLKAVMGSGFLKMNPAVVTVCIHQTLSHQTHITIQGVAKEGLIKQRAGEKAARFIAQRITESKAALELFGD